MTSPVMPQRPGPEIRISRLVATVASAMFIWLGVGMAWMVESLQEENYLFAALDFAAWGFGTAAGFFVLAWIKRREAGKVEQEAST